MVRQFVGQVVLMALAVALLFAPSADASVIAYNTPTGSLDASGNPISAQATVSSTGGVITVTLQNNQANPKEAGQLISDFGFTLAVYNHVTGQETGFFGGTGTLDTNVVKTFGIYRTVFGDKTFSDSFPPQQPAGWALQNVAFSVYRLCDLCPGGSGPAHMIIGNPDPADGFHYTNADATITGGGGPGTSGPGSPFLAGVVQFTINIPGITSSETADVYADSVFFSFGPTDTPNIAGQCIISCLPGRTVPEPSALLLLGVGVIGLAGFGWRARRPMK